MLTDGATKVRVMLARIRDLFAASRIAAERDDEFAFHLDMETERNRKLGMSPEEAHRVARIAFGGRSHFREATRDARGVASIQDTVRDIRFAIRRLTRAPGFTIGITTTLGVGVGVAMAIGVLVNGVLLRPLPFTEPDRLVQIDFRTPGFDGGREHAHSPATYRHFSEAKGPFVAMGAYHLNDAVNFTDGDNPERVTAVMISASALRVLGVEPVLGRLLVDADTAAQGIIPVLISHTLWQQRYGGDSAMAGRIVEINRRPRRVVGVLPAGFNFPVPAAAVWFPLDVGGRASLQSRYLEVIARLRDRAGIEDAQRELTARIARFPERFPEITREQLARSAARVEVLTLRDATVASVREHLRLLAFVMVFVLLIVVANVSNLFLLRAERLRREVAVTIALGGGAWALARRFVTEGLVLGAGGAVIALPIVALAVQSRFGFTSREIPRLHELTLTVGLMSAVVLTVVVIAVGISLIAFARVSRTQPVGAHLSTARTTAGGPWRRVQQALVATQVAAALTLLLSAVLFGRSLWNLGRVDLGFVPSGRVSFEATLPFSGYETYEKSASFHANVIDRVRRIAGISGAEAALEIPLIQENPGELSLGIDAVGANKSHRAAANMVTPGYFRLMGIPVLQGRTFAGGDVRSELPGVVISASLARALFDRIDVVGRVVRPPSSGPDVFFRVVGVVGDVPRWRVEERDVAMVYFPLVQDGNDSASRRMPIILGSARYVMTTERSIAQLVPELRTAVREVDRRVPLTNFTSLPQMVSAATARVRLTMVLLTWAAVAALILGVIGVYSIVSYTVASRQREIGVRIALGATPARVRRMVIGEGATLGVAGVVVGIVAALATGRLARSLLYGIAPTDPITYAAVAALLIVVVMAASMVPAHRASTIDPTEVMRGE